MSFNIYDLAAKDYAVLKVPHPVTKLPTGATVTVAGPASAEYGTQKARLGELLKQGDMTPMQSTQENARFLAGCITGWSDMGVEFSREEAEKLLLDPHMYPFRNWLDNEIVNVANFIKA